MIEIIILLFFCSVAASFVLFRFYPNTKIAIIVIFGVVVFIASSGIIIGDKAFKSMDTEIWNGSIQSKTREEVSCSHSYSCNCRNVTTCTGSGSSKSCSTTEVCDTCYEHPYDVDWLVHSDIKSFTISRVNRQGTQMPPRWNEVKIGDAVAVEKLHTNYIKAAGFSLFHESNEEVIKKFNHRIPEYPNSVYDYYKINRVFSDGVAIPNIKAWSDDISGMLTYLGPKKQVNIIILFTNADQQYAHAVNAKWLGGKKNDVIVIIGSSAYPKIDWVQVLTWSDSEIFKVNLRDSILSLENIERAAILQTIKKNVNESFVRKQMKDFKYLENEIEISVYSIFSALAFILFSLVVVMFIQSRQKLRFKSRRFSRF